MRIPSQPPAFPPTEETIRESLSRLAGRQPIQVLTAGVSREGRSIPAIHLGDGPIAVSITAGAHSDEPAGPLAALALPDLICQSDELLHGATWTIFPHVNPDGAARNSRWFSPAPSLERYIRHVFREQPGDDVEFNYPSNHLDGYPGDAPPPRPENLAVAEVLKLRAPFDLHLSLHGMGFAEGAWWLIGRKDISRTAPLRRELAALFQRHGFPLHDMERHGEKGFHRIEPGFCTTPDSLSMRRFFEERGDPLTASRFLPSSMEFVESLGGDPLVMVSELPLFMVGTGQYTAVRQRLAPLREKGGEAASSAALRELTGGIVVTPVPFATAVAALVEAVVTSVRFLQAQR